MLTFLPLFAEMIIFVVVLKYLSTFLVIASQTQTCKIFEYCIFVKLKD